MTVRFIENPSRLGRKLSAPGGKSIADAVAGAEAAIAAAAPDGLVALDQAISTIAAVMTDSGAGQSPTAAALEAVYREAAQIHGAAAVFGLPDLGEAAWSLCELIDAGGASSRTGPAAMISHLNSLRLLRQGDAVPAPQRRALLDGLQDLRLHQRNDSAPG